MEAPSLNTAAREQMHLARESTVPAWNPMVVTPSPRAFSCAYACQESALPSTSWGGARQSGRGW
jgi:hypothetical protein